MTRSHVLLITLCALCFSFLSPVCSGSFDASRYKEVKREVIKATPEEYKSKRICLETFYFRYHTNFPDYMVKSGIKSGKYYCLVIVPANLPVIAKKKDFNEQVIGLKPNQKVKVYGKVKKFKRASRMGLPSYYLDLDHLEMPKKEEGKSDKDDDEGDLKQPENPTPGQGQGRGRWNRRKQFIRRWKGQHNRPQPKDDKLAPEPPEKLK